MGLPPSRDELLRVAGANRAAPTMGERSGEMPRWPYHPGILQHNARMTEDITRPELDAKLEAIEARLEGRVARIEDAVERMVKDTERMRAELLADNATTRASISNLKVTTIATGIGAVITIVLGVAAFNATVLSNMVASFDSGKGLATSLAETAAKVDAVSRRLDAASPAQAPTTAPPPQPR